MNSFVFFSLCSSFSDLQAASSGSSDLEQGCLMQFFVSLKIEVNDIPGTCDVVILLPLYLEFKLYGGHTSYILLSANLCCYGHYSLIC